MLLTPHQSNPLTDIYWRIDPALSAVVLLTGATSPLWGPLLARTCGWPRSLGARLAVGPFGGLLLAGYVHDALRYRAGYPTGRTARIELGVNGVFLLAVTVLPLIRYLRRNQPSAQPMLPRRTSYR